MAHLTYSACAVSGRLGDLGASQLSAFGKTPARRIACTSGIPHHTLDIDLCCSSSLVGCNTHVGYARAGIPPNRLNFIVADENGSDGSLQHIVDKLNG